VLLRLQGVDDDAVLHVGVVAHVEGLPLVAADRREGRHEDVFPDADIADDGPQRVHVGRGVDHGVANLRAEIGLDVLAYHLYLHAPKAQF